MDFDIKKPLADEFKAKANGLFSSAPKMADSKEMQITYMKALDWYEQAQNAIDGDSKFSAEQKKLRNAIQSILHCNQSTAFFKLGDCQNAIEHASKSIDKDSSNAKAYVRKASAYSVKGDEEEAIKAYKNAILL
jgi:Flp pilus assembly protein TadD